MITTESLPWLRDMNRVEELELSLYFSLLHKTIMSFIYHINLLNICIAEEVNKLKSKITKWLLALWQCSNRLTKIVINKL